jgi:hypothetical protein
MNSSMPGFTLGRRAPAELTPRDKGHLRLSNPTNHSASKVRTVGHWPGRQASTDYLDVHHIDLLLPQVAEHQQQQATGPR